jgi:hypothetical protein
MNRDEAFISQLEDYLEDFDGVTPLPDRVRVAVAAELPRTPQVRPAGIPRRVLNMTSQTSTPARLGLAAAALVVALVAGAALINNGSQTPPIGAASPTPSPTPTTTPSPTGTANPTDTPPPEADRPTPVERYQAALASLTLEEVAPGIVRVIGDETGVWRSASDWEDVSFGPVAFAPDGTIWIVSGDGAGSSGLQSIGRDPEYFATSGPLAKPDEVTFPGMGDIFDIAVGADGKVWVAELGALATFDGDAWELDYGRVGSFEIMPDGTPWALRRGETADGMQVRPMTLGGFEVAWPPLGLRYDRDQPGDIAVTTGGDIWIGVQQGGDGWLARADGDTWTLEQPLGDTPFGVHALAAAPDGALWALLMTATTNISGHSCCQPLLARFDGDTWSTWSADDGLPLGETYIWGAVGGVATVGEPGTPFAVAPDGTLWVGDLGRGVISFDGTTFTEYEAGPGSERFQGQATEIAFAPDGTIWAEVGAEVGPGYDVGLYVIDPEAVAAE